MLHIKMTEMKMLIRLGTIFPALQGFFLGRRAMVGLQWNFINFDPHKCKATRFVKLVYLLTQPFIIMEKL